MMRFFQNAPLEYCVAENDNVLAKGRLKLNQAEIEILMLEATEETHDFLFRAMLNVCASKKGFTVYATLEPEYLKQFGFELDNALRCAVTAEHITFPGCRHAETNG